MGKVILSADARLDLKEIFEFIAKGSKKFASKELENIYDQMDRLLLNPKIGKPFATKNKINYSEFVLKHYRIIYSMSQENIHIHFVHHSARDLNRRTLTE